MTRKKQQAQNLLQVQGLAIAVVDYLQPALAVGPYIYDDKRRGRWSAYYPVGNWGYTSCLFETREEAIDWLISMHGRAQARKAYVQLSLFESLT